MDLTKVLTITEDTESDFERIYGDCSEASFYEREIELIESDLRIDEKISLEELYTVGKDLASELISDQDSDRLWNLSVQTAKSQAQFFSNASKFDLKGITCEEIIWSRKDGSGVSRTISLLRDQSLTTDQLLQPLVGQDSFFSNLSTARKSILSAEETLKSNNIGNTPFAKPGNIGNSLEMDPSTLEPLEDLFSNQAPIQSRSPSPIIEPMESIESLFKNCRNETLDADVERLMQEQQQESAESCKDSENPEEQVSLASSRTDTLRERSEGTPSSEGGLQENDEHLGTQLSEDVDQILLSLDTQLSAESKGAIPKTKIDKKSKKKSEKNTRVCEEEYLTWKELFEGETDEEIRSSISDWKVTPLALLAHHNVLSDLMCIQIDNQKSLLNETKDVILYQNKLAKQLELIQRSLEAAPREDSVGLNYVAAINSRMDQIAGSLSTLERSLANVMASLKGKTEGSNIMTSQSLPAKSMSKPDFAPSTMRLMTTDNDNKTQEANLTEYEKKLLSSDRNQLTTRQRLEKLTLLSKLESKSKTSIPEQPKEKITKRVEFSRDHKASQQRSEEKAIPDHTSSIPEKGSPLRIPSKLKEDLGAKIEKLAPIDSKFWETLDVTPENFSALRNNEPIKCLVSKVIIELEGQIKLQTSWVKYSPRWNAIITRIGTEVQCSEIAKLKYVSGMAQAIEVLKHLLDFC